MGTLDATLFDDIFVPEHTTEDAIFGATNLAGFFAVGIDGITFAPSGGAFVDDCFFTTFEELPPDFF